MKVPIVSVQFINVVSFGGQIKSASAVSPSNPERAGSTPFEIELDEASGIFKVTKTLSGVVKSKYVPMTNVASFEVDERPVEKAEPKPAVKK